MIEIEVGGFNVADANMDILIEARAVIETEILTRAAEELMQIEKRKQMLEQMLGSSDRVLDAPEIAMKRRRESINPPKYCNPDNPTITWTGRGKAPSWFNPENPVVVAVAPADLVSCCNNHNHSASNPPFPLL